MVARVCWLLFGLPWLASSLPAQETGETPPGISTLAGVFTADQAEKGAQTYRKNCTACHAPIAYTGLAFRRVWSGRSIYDFFDLIRTTMPNDSPGKLSRGQYAEIMAYLIKLNGLPTGEKELPDSDDELKAIRIELPPRATP
jgi:hypothetical protein